MRYFTNVLAMMLVLIGVNAKADQISSLTVEVCDQVTNREIAADMLNQMAVGLDEQLKTSCSVQEEFVRFPRFERDVLQNRIKVQDAQLKAIEQLRDEEGPMNLVVVTYELTTQDKKTVQGQFSFSRYNSDSRIQKRGCAFMQKAASQAFILSQCAQ
jgi:hypothetical protein